MNEVELQLFGLKFSDGLDNKVQVMDKMPLMQKHLVGTVMTMPGTTVEEEFCRRNAAINAVAAYCHFQEGGAVAMPCRRPRWACVGFDLEYFAYLNPLTHLRYPH